MRFVVYSFLILFGICFLTLPIAIPIIKSSADLSIFNSNWNGLSEFAKLCFEKGDVVPILYSYDSVKIGERSGTLLIISPSIDFSDTEVEEVRLFLEKGGTVFIADDSGISNSLLAKLGVKARFSGKVMDIFYDKNENFPIVLRIEGGISKGVEKIKLNMPSAIIGVEGDITTSKASFLREMDAHVIFAVLKYGNGKLILFSDPSALMNEMLTENRQFALNLIELLGSGTFYFDEAHRLDFNPYSVATLYIQRELDSTSAFILIFFVAILAIFFESGILNNFIKITFFFRKIIRRRKREDLLSDLPEWVDRRKLMEMLERMGYDGDVEERNR